jgi:TonB family protein
MLAVLERRLGLGRSFFGRRWMNWFTRTEAVGVESDAEFAPTAQFERTAVVAMTVDASGKPTDLKIVQSVNPLMDRNVLNAVSQYHFAPGTLDNQPTAVPVNLAVVSALAANSLFCVMGPQRLASM